MMSYDLNISQKCLPFRKIETFNIKIRNDGKSLLMLGANSFKTHHHLSALGEAVYYTIRKACGLIPVVIVAKITQKYNSGNPRTSAIKFSKRGVFLCNANIWLSRMDSNFFELFQQQIIQIAVKIM